MTDTPAPRIVTFRSYRRALLLLWFPFGCLFLTVTGDGVLVRALGAAVGLVLWWSLFVFVFYYRRWEYDGRELFVPAPRRSGRRYFAAPSEIVVEATVPALRMWVSGRPYADGELIAMGSIWVARRDLSEWIERWGLAFEPSGDVDRL